MAVVVGGNVGPVQHSNKPDGWLKAHSDVEGSMVGSRRPHSHSDFVTHVWLILCNARCATTPVVCAQITTTRT